MENDRRRQNDNSGNNNVNQTEIPRDLEILMNSVLPNESNQPLPSMDHLDQVEGRGSARNNEELYSFAMEILQKTRGGQ
ncbi:hypothetical protein Pcinc_014407 [Petrolisthes cinctipes]|uniref:Uncharacterized protein n=1 Tax=Petrolisthes cinctipes TaxID=88211 RepID=A0AAE1G0C4_PETCI|nr:hypothetical protein Pcinc_014407 [Petrolisthes cinctipes]